MTLLEEIPSGTLPESHPRPQGDRAADDARAASRGALNDIDRPQRTVVFAENTRVSRIRVVCRMPRISLPAPTSLRR